MIGKLARGEQLSAKCYDDIASQLASKDGFPTEGELQSEEMEGVQVKGKRICLGSLEVSSNVNALVPGGKLQFPEEGLVVVYGDNGSGKSGFARILKGVARSRHQEDVLSDIFEDKVKPSAEVVILVDGVSQKPYAWLGDYPTELRQKLRQIGFFDEACGDEYLDKESEMTFRPAEIFLLEDLILACDGVREKLEQLLQDNANKAVKAPAVSEGGIAFTVIANLLAGKAVDLAVACALEDDANKQLEDLKGEENRLGAFDLNQERKRLTALARHASNVGEHLSKLEARLLPSQIKSVQTSQEEAVRLRSAADSLSGERFGSEPVPGVGLQTWRALWEAARSFADNEAFPSQSFPVETKVCVLCHQDLDGDSLDRFDRFETWVKEESKSKAAAAESKAEAAVNSLLQVVVSPPDLLMSLDWISGDDPKIGEVLRSRLKAFEQVVSSTDDMTACLAAAEATHEGDGAVEAKSLEDIYKTKAASTDLSLYATQLETVSAKRVELEDQILMSDARELLEEEIKRLSERKLLEDAKKLTDTSKITRKAVELTKSHVTTAVNSQFGQEASRLRLKRVTLKDTGGQKGRLQQRPSFDDAIQQPEMAKVLSEGEQTALGLAGFFTEACLDESKSAIVLDDPVSSLDHIRRELVAKRLVEFSKERQVVVFTHDITFVAELSRYAKESKVLMIERLVERDGKDKPGVCSEVHPWKVRDVETRLGELKMGLAQIRKGCKDQAWSQDKREKETADWAGKLSETWERMLSQELVGRIVDRGTLEVRPKMLKLFARLTVEDDKEFQESYARVSRWARRHDKSPEVNYSAPEIDYMKKELNLVCAWFKRIKKYAND